MEREIEREYINVYMYIYTGLGNDVALMTDGSFSGYMYTYLHIYKAIYIYVYVA
jgi:dihydroxyacid dehydratase/phosphogluconate dehydratase